MSTDRIEKKIVLRAPRSRVWRALTDAEQFGAWFGVKMAGAFVAGATVKGAMTVKGYENMPMEIAIDRIEPERLFSYRWHPYAIEPNFDYSGEPMTLVELHLTEAAEGGTELRVVESGFDALPAHRRAEALRMNEGGWRAQLENIARHVAA